MSRSFFTTALAVTLGLVAGACNEQQVPTAGDEAGFSATPGSPANSFSNNPDNGNPRIFRFNNGASFLIVDDDANLFSLQSGRDFLFLSTLGPPPCREATFLSFEDIQRILHDPDDPNSAMIKEIRQGKDIFIAVFQGPLETVSDCDDLISRLLGQGRGNFTNTDNDMFQFLREDRTNNHNAWGLTAQGTVELLGGGSAHYNGLSKCVWDGLDIFSIKCVDKINLR